MIRRVLIAGAAISAGLLATLTAAPPAGADTIVGCQGNNCSASLDQFITYKGDYTPNGTSHLQVTEDPPPCLWVQIGDAVTGSNYIIGQFPNPDKGLPFGIYDSVQQAKKLLANPQPGSWFNLPINPAAGPAGLQACLKLPAFVFVPPGQTPPMPRIPPRILAEYAYNHMLIPAPALTTSPANKGWVNLATFVWTNSPRQRQISATLGNETVTVVARPAQTTITASGAGTIYTAGCGPNGSHYPAAHPPTTGPGTPPDCGVLWQTPTTAATITATVTWDVTWGPGNNTLPPIPMTGTSPAMPVAEIQTINGG
jgi:hypothetical protein